MATWQFAVELGDDAQTPVFRQIARAITVDIERGRLRPGERLPSSRALSAQLGVNRSTVIAAYDELSAFGWIAGQPARGMFVAAGIPGASPHTDGARGSARRTRHPAAA